MSMENYLVGVLMISKNNLFILLLFNSLLLWGSYNTPFINTYETLKLTYGMDKIDVENELGKPLYVLSGENDSKKIIWVYEVRTIEIQSKRIKPGVYAPTKSKYYIPQRASGNTTIHSEPIHRIQVEFINNKVSSWGPIQQKNINTGKELNKKTDKITNNEATYSEIIIIDPDLSNDSKKVGFFFDPKIMMRFDSWHITIESENGNYYQDEIKASTNGGSVGFHSGFKFEKARIGLDCRLGSGGGVMLSFERNMDTEFNILIGVGIDVEEYEVYDDDSYYDNDDYYYDYPQKIGFVKLELSKNFGKFNLGIGTIPNFEDDDGGGMIYLNSKIRLLN